MEKSFKYDQRRVVNLIVFLLDHRHSSGEAVKEIQWMLVRIVRVDQVIVALISKLYRWGLSQEQWRGTEEAQQAAAWSASTLVSSPLRYRWKNVLLSDPLEPYAAMSLAAWQTRGF